MSIRNRRTAFSLFASSALSLLLLASAEAFGASRVVSVDGGVTEIIYALQAEKALVGVDTTSRYPEAAQQLPQVGYRRTLTAEGILALAPERVITTPDAGPATTLSQLEKSGVQLDRLPPITRPEDIALRIAQIAQWLDVSDAGERLQQQVLAELAGVRAQAKSQPSWRTLFLLAAGARGVMVAGKDSQAQQILDVLALTNVATEVSGYKPLTPEAALTLAPEVIIIAETTPGAFRIVQWPTLAATPAARHHKVIVMDSMYLLGFGPRLPQALTEIQKALSR